MANISTAEGYLDSLPEPRREAVEELRSLILKNIDKTFEEGIQYGMIGDCVPHSKIKRHPDTMRREAA